LTWCLANLHRVFEYERALRLLPKYDVFSICSF
jgi:hypothetical protein